MADSLLQDLIDQAETREEPETTAEPQEDKNRVVPETVDIEEHRSEGVS